MRNCLKSHRESPCRVRHAAACHPKHHGSPPDSITRPQQLVDTVIFPHMAIHKQNLWFMPTMAIQVRCFRTSVPASLHQTQQGCAECTLTQQPTHAQHWSSTFFPRHPTNSLGSPQSCGHQSDTGYLPYRASVYDYAWDNAIDCSPGQ